MGVLSDEDLVAMRARARHRLIGALALVVVLVVGLPLVLDRHDPPPAPESTDGEARPAGDAKAALPDAMPPTRGAAADAVGAPGAGEAGAPGKAAAAASGPADPAPKPAAEGTPGAGADLLKSAAAVPQPVPGAPKTAAEAPKTAAEAPKTATEAPKTAAEAPKTAADTPTAPAEPPGTVPPLDIHGPVRRGEHAAPAGAHATPGGPANHDAASTHTPARVADAASGAAGTHAVAGDDSGHAGGTRGWFVQFGVFADASRAEALSRRLGDHGIMARDESIQGPRGSFRRVRAGPFGARDGADEVLARARALGENAILVHQ